MGTIVILSTPEKQPEGLVEMPYSVEQWAGFAMAWLYELSKVMTLDDIDRLGANPAGGIRWLLESYPLPFTPEDAQHEPAH